MICVFNSNALIGGRMPHTLFEKRIHPTSMTDGREYCALRVSSLGVLDFASDGIRKSVNQIIKITILW